MADLIAEGDYEAIATGNGGLSETKTGTSQVMVEFRITEDCKDHGRTIPYYGFITDKTIERTHESLGLMGFQGSLDDLGDEEKFKAGVTKNKVRIVVKHDTYEGKTSAKIAFVNSLDGAGIKNRLDPVKVKMLSAKMGGAWANLNKGYQQVGPSATETMDKLPF